MDRRRFLLASVAGALAAPLVAEAQQPGKVVRIGWLGDGANRAPHLLEALLQGLRDLGYVEGRNLVVERRYAEGKLDRIPGFMAELVALNTDVIVATSTPNALNQPQDREGARSHYSAVATGAGGSGD